MQLIINAGGTGTRLWPLSTNSNPKQFAKLIDEEVLIVKTYNRLIEHFDSNSIWISTNIRFVDLVKKHLPDFPLERIIIEPEKRDTFASVCSNAAVVASKVGHEEAIINIQSDNFIYPEDNSTYAQALKNITHSLELNEFDLITCGIKPAFANTQLGYVEIDIENKERVYNKPCKVKQFREKPDLETAQEFVTNGNFFWHWGTYSFTYKSLLKMINEYMPKYFNLTEKIRQKGSITSEDYSQFEKISWDYAINEKCQNMGIIVLDIYWDDIGTWQTVSKYLPEITNDKNLLQIGGEENKVKTIDSNRKVAFVGVSNLMLIESEEGILIIDPKKSGEVKEVAKFFDK
jgi:mannose-1-phosphate guanylyltransferase